MVILQYCAKGLKGETNGTKGETDGTKGETNGTEGETTGPKGEAKGPKGETKGPITILRYLQISDPRSGWFVHLCCTSPFPVKRQDIQKGS